MRIKVILILILLISLNCISQTTINISSDLRYKGLIEGEGIGFEDKAGLMQDFTVKMQWWTLLGEPVEIYGFLWNSSGSYSTEIDGAKQSISRSELTKYPDLIKRFDNIRPYKVDLLIYGNAGGKTTSVKRGAGFEYASFYNKGFSYKTKGQSYDPYVLDAPILYNVPDAKLLVSKSGRMSMSTVPESPMYWNDFLRWAWRSSSYQSGPTTGYVINKDEYEFKNFNKAKKDALNKELKHLYYNTTSFTLSARITNLEWPKYELKGIIEDYKKYEIGEKQPSPKEEIEAAEEDIAKAKPYTKDDFWGDYTTAKDPEIETFKKDDYYGLRYKGTSNEILSPTKYYKIERKGAYFIARTRKYGDCYGWKNCSYWNNKVLLNEKGELIIDEKFSSFKSAYSGGFYVERNDDCKMIELSTGHYANSTGEEMDVLQYSISGKKYDKDMNYIKSYHQEPSITDWGAITVNSFHKKPSCY